ncbi:hypothetical protein [Paradevosia shaoguanensis]|uniref:hypothetical protein n=1 Tax=Paradevosia shaoguanensis TaxID=1335043 RepID=UPI00193165D4|nr:hypothetical protein [Paradevosia shaoguanensis]
MDLQIHSVRLRKEPEQLEIMGFYAGFTPRTGIRRSAVTRPGSNAEPSFSDGAIMFSDLVFLAGGMASFLVAGLLVLALERLK